MSTGIASPGAGPQEIPRVPARSRHPIGSFWVRRLAAGLATLLVASFLVFLATNALPGNVAQVVLGRNATPSAVTTLDRRLDLDRPVLARYGSWLWGAIHGNFGQDAVQLSQGSTNAPVSAIIGKPLANSAILAAVVIVLLVPLSLAVGVVSGMYAGRAVDHTVSYVSLVFGILPEFVLGTFLILVFFTGLHLLPPVALLPPGGTPFSKPDALILPVMTLLGVTIAFCARQIRAGVIEVLRLNYPTMARINGIPARRVLWRYVLRNALASSIQTYAQAITYLLGGIIVVESLFAYPGVGQLLVQSVASRDVPVVLAVAVILAAAIILINIVADFLVVLLVPKLRTSLK
jgi:peptide/nickel transport system permease protein